MGCASGFEERDENPAPPEEDGDARKILLLGPGGSGKTTFLKQALLLYHEEKTRSDIETNKDELLSSILTNLAEGCQALCEAALAVPDISEADQEILAPKLKAFEEAAALQTAEEGSVSTSFLSSDPAALLEFWRMSVVQKAWRGRGSHPQLEDSLAYWFANLPRVLDPECKPTVDDFLRVREKTTKACRHAVKVDGTKLVFLVAEDAWAGFLDEKNIVLWIVDASSLFKEYEGMNEMEESLENFDELFKVFGILSNNFSINVYLNKRDVLEEMLASGANPATSFPDCTATDAGGVAEFFFQKFKAIAKKHGHKIDPRLCTGFSRGNMQGIFEEVASDE